MMSFTELNFWIQSKHQLYYVLLAISKEQRQQRMLRGGYL